MSLNLCVGIDPKKVAKFGKYFGSIDFTVYSSSRSSIKRYGRDVEVGELLIGSRSHKLSISELEALIYDICFNEQCNIPGYYYEDLTRYELERIVETLQSAKQVFFQKYRFGM